MYITTHLSDEHYAYLEQCWPALLAKGPLFQLCDYMMFVTEASGQKANLSLIHSVFDSTGITVHSTPNPGYNEGAIVALKAAFEHDWFHGYDWVIRLNPDVLIRNDTSLLEHMHDVQMNGIFVDCADRPCPRGHQCVDRLVHTDFFAVRPSAVSYRDILDANHTHPESMATEAFSSIVKNGSDAWLSGTGPHHGNCRVEGESSPVIHTHEFGMIHPACLSWYP